MRTLACFFVLCTSWILGLSQDLHQLPQIIEAKKEQKHIILVFSGSDWCMPCIRFQKEVLENVRFIEATKRDFEIIKADFPQRKKQDRETIRQNEILAEEYNSKGLFPAVFLLAPDLKTTISLEYTHFDPDMFTKDVLRFSRDYGYKMFEKRSHLMGCNFEFTLVDKASSTDVYGLLDDCIHEVQRIESLISEWDTESQVSQLNHYAGVKPVAVDEEVFQLIERSKILSRLTQGAFDISFLPLLDLWTFDGTAVVSPAADAIKSKVELVDYEGILLKDSSQVYLHKRGMKIGFGGVGKGYAADRVKKMMIAEGIKDGVINASGDLVAWGKPPNEKFWKIAIAHPQDPEKIICWLPVNDGAVATSGDYEKYLVLDGNRKSHIIDPKTGLPTEGITSATVISSSAELSDALATAIFVMGIDAGMNLIEQLPNAECLIIDSEMNLYFSSNLNYINNEE